MIGRFKAMFRERDRAAPATAPTSEEKHLAAAVLMVEAARLDDHFDAAERDKVGEIIRRHFGATEAEAEALIEAAETAHDGASGLVRFTRVIKETYSPEQRIEVIEMLWEVAYADGVLHDYEANLLRRVGGLIYVSDRDRGAARKRVLERLGHENSTGRA